MMRNIFMISTLCLALALGLGGCNQKDDSPRVAVVDAEKVFQTSQLAKKGMEYIEGVSSKFNERILKMQEAAQADPDNQEMMQEFQAELMSLQGDFEARQTEAANKINRLFEEVVAEYRTKNNLDMIVYSQAVISSSASVDATDGIISLLDSKQLDFGSADAPIGNTPPPAPAGETGAAEPAAAPTGDAAPAPGAAAPEAAPAPAGEAATK